MSEEERIAGKYVQYRNRIGAYMVGFSLKSGEIDEEKDIVPLRPEKDETSFSQVKDKSGTYRLVPKA
jgi:hypothetical protein